MKVTRVIGQLERGDIRLTRHYSGEGVIAFRIDGIVIGSVFGRDDYDFEFRPTKADGRFRTFRARKVADIQARLKGL